VGGVPVAADGGVRQAGHAGAVIMGGRGPESAGVLLAVYVLSVQIVPRDINGGWVFGMPHSVVGEKVVCAYFLVDRPWQRYWIRQMKD
jgi:hypothetical protein